MLVRFSTDDVAAPERLAAWEGFYAERVYRVTVETAPGPETFRAGAQGYVCGEFALLDVQAEIARFRRTSADIARDRKDAVIVWRLRRPMRCHASDRRPAIVVDYEPGDFCVHAAEWTFDAETPEGASYEVLVVPNAAISPHLTGGRLVRPVRARAESPLGALLGAAFDAAHQQAPQLPERLAEGVLRNLAGLVALVSEAAGSSPDVERDATRATQFAMVKRHIDAHLADADLSPAGVAAAVGISVRRLHRLFEPTGASFARHVLRQRLLRCRDAIASATGSGRSVIDIAFGWGFNSMATFYRAFASEFGASPGALRSPPRKSGEL